MDILGWIVVGFVAGAFAKPVAAGLIRRGGDPGWNIGCLGTIAIGVLGGLIGGALFSWAGGEGIGHFGLRSIFVAFIGAVLLLLIVGLVGGRSHQTRR